MLAGCLLLLAGTVLTGLHQTALVYCAVIAALAAVAAGSLIVRGRSRPGHPIPRRHSQ
jgi:hypothetical protein